MVPPQTFCYFATLSTHIPSNTNVSLEPNVNWTPPINCQNSEDENDMLLDFIQEMYDKSFDVVNLGGTGILLGEPKLAYTRAKQRYDSYMLARYIDPDSGKPYDKWLTREQAVQYCTQRGCLLVDETDELFIMFHWTMHNAIQIVFSETLTFDDQGMQVSNTSLQHWSFCSFTGEDTFLEVMDKLGNSVVTIAHYVQFCLDILFISDFMSYLQPDENK